jgi:hypothetical protein
LPGFAHSQACTLVLQENADFASGKTFSFHTKHIIHHVIDRVQLESWGRIWLVLSINLWHLSAGYSYSLAAFSFYPWSAEFAGKPLAWSARKALFFGPKTA